MLTFSYLTIHTNWENLSFVGDSDEPRNSTTAKPKMRLRVGWYCNWKFEWSDGSHLTRTHSPVTYIQLHELLWTVLRQEALTMSYLGVKLDYGKGTKGHFPSIRRSPSSKILPPNAFLPEFLTVIFIRIRLRLEDTILRTWMNPIKGRSNGRSYLFGRWQVLCSVCRTISWRTESMYNAYRKMN